jgi:uncharacterized Zn finger protein
MNSFRLEYQKGSVGNEWWGEEFIVLMEDAGDVGRLSRGRAYARQGQIRTFAFTGDGIEATVIGSQVCRITVIFPQYSTEEKKIILDWLKSQPVWMNRLVAGELVEEFVDTVREQSNIDIIPTYEDMVVRCTCPDYINPCKHAAAVYYYLGECVDKDPFLFFTLRGFAKETIFKEFRRTRQKTRNDGDETPAERRDLMKTYYEMQAPLGLLDFALSDSPSKHAAYLEEWGKSDVKLQRRDVSAWLADAYPRASTFAESIARQIAEDNSQKSSDES